MAKLPRDKFTVTLDSAHPATFWDQTICRDVWQDKYRFEREASPTDTFERVVQGVYAKDPNEHEKDKALTLMLAGLWMPGGRIIAGAGTSKNVTLLNCYVSPDIDDSMEGIAEGLKAAMLTLRQGGGIGINFSTLRPRGARLKSLGHGAFSSGAVSFMHAWNAACGTIMSAGSRRGAMMGVMADSHPDLVEFIKAKQTPGVLTNFNVSILVSDALMDAVKQDEMWSFYFKEPPASGMHLGTFATEEGTQYVYSEMQARELWDLITKSTYEYSEPGVIFIDRVNELNNLNHVETISCTNPCGEQPLPANGACDLGAINLARMVRYPFTERAFIDPQLLRATVYTGVRFLDNVLDVAQYPLEAQAQEARVKRRIGLGITGLADALAMVGDVYGSPTATQQTSAIMRLVRLQAYEASAALAEERGPCEVMTPKHAEGHKLLERVDDPRVQKQILKHGLRNGVILTIAPTGTTSIFYGNVSSGLEPVFAHKVSRKILQADGSRKGYTAYGYSYQLWCASQGLDVEKQHDLPHFLITADQLSVQDHLLMQSACQNWVDSSVSKTINCPTDLSFEDFQGVYTEAYRLGLKGCTTYRPSEVRGSVLEKADSKPASKETAPTASSPAQAPVLRTTDDRLLPRPAILEGRTYKVKWPTLDAALYITINDVIEDGKRRPYEVFINSKSAAFDEWMSAVTRMVSAILRKSGDTQFISEELQQISSVHNSAWIDGKLFNSIVAYLGYLLQRHSEEIGALAEPQQVVAAATVCPKCGSRSMVHEDGCKVCKSCGHSTCG